MTGLRHAPAALLALAALTPALATGAEKLSRQEVAQLGKAATAYVHVKLPGGTGSGSAFCVHPSGLFVTNQHVIDGATAVTLVLNPGRKDQKVYAAEVRYADAEADLALLRVADATGLPALALGSDDGVAELTEVVACGFPFGEALAVGRGEYPAVSINAGAVTALRRKGDALHRLQLDASLNPGNSGGPVLGPDGKVVGVVVAGVKGSGVNFAIPVSHVTRFVDRVDLRLASPALGRENFHRPTEFAVTAAAVLDADKPLDLELALWAAGEKPRRHKLELKDGAYRATAQVFPVPDGPPALRVTATYGSDSVSGSAADAAFRVGGQEVRLADVRAIARDKGGKGHTVRVAGDKVLTGDLTGLDRVPVTVGGKAHEFDLGAADAVAVDSPTRIPAVRYTVVATRGGREVGRLGGFLVNEDVARKAYLSDLPEFDVRVGYGSFGKNGELGYEGKECIVKGVKAAKGLSTHPPHNGHASVKYRLGRKAYMFRTGVGLLDSPDDAASPCTFEVLADGKSVWKSKPIKSPKVTDECQLDLAGVDVLELRVSIPGDFGRARAIWVDPNVLTGDIPAGPARAGAAPAPRAEFHGRAPYIFGSIKDPQFKTVGPTGGVLIGLTAKFTKFGDRDIVRAVRPIYRVGGKEEDGPVTGADLTGAVTLKARDGYAVGGMAAKADWWCHGFSLTYMRVKPDGTLDPKDSYDSEWAGWDGRLDVNRITGEGKPAVGLVGKIVRGDTTALGLLFQGQEGFDPDAPVREDQQVLTVPVGKEPFILGSIRDPQFKSVGPAGGVLIGLEAKFTKFGAHDIVRAVRPIYRVDSKEEAGKQVGGDLTGAVTLKARDGYAVGAISGKAKLWCHGFSLTYMRVKPDGTLDPKDSYDSEWAGWDGSMPVTRASGDGAPVVGIVGKIVGTETTALGLLFKGQEGFDPGRGR